VEGIGSVLVRVPGDQLQGMIAAVSDPPLTAVLLSCAPKLTDLYHKPSV